MNKWKFIALFMICIFISTLALGYASQKPNRVPLTDEQKEMVVSLAKDAIKDELRGNYTVDVGKTHWKIGKKFGGEKDRKIAYVFFAVEDRTFAVVVDMDEGKVVRITENRGWMAKYRTQKRWRH